MNFIRESELNLGQNAVVEIPQPGNPVSARTTDELGQIAKKLGTELKTDEEGRAYISIGPLGYYFDTQGRVVQIDLLRRMRNYADEKLVWGVERRQFDYDDLGRLCGLKTSRSITGSLWAIMEQKHFSYTNGGYRIVQTVIDGLVTSTHS